MIFHAIESISCKPRRLCVLAPAGTFCFCQFDAWCCVYTPVYCFESLQQPPARVAPAIAALPLAASTNTAARWFQPGPGASTLSGRRQRRQDPRPDKHMHLLSHCNGAIYIPAAAAFKMLSLLHERNSRKPNLWSVQQAITTQRAPRNAFRNRPVLPWQGAMTCKDGARCDAAKQCIGSNTTPTATKLSTRD